MKSIFATLLIAITFVSGLHAQSLEGTTWSYTERVFGEDEVKTITSYFVFTTSTEVLWLFETPSNNVLPAGIGRYDAQRGNIVFDYKNITRNFRGGLDEESIVFGFKATGTQGIMVCSKSDFWPSYNNGEPFTVQKERYHFRPDANLVGTWWKCEEVDGKPATSRTENYTLCFKSKYELLINGETVMYISFGNTLFFVTKSQLRGIIGHVSDDGKTIRCDVDGVLFSPESQREYNGIMRLGLVE